MRRQMNGIMKLYVDYFNDENSIAVAVSEENLSYNLAILQRHSGHDTHLLSLGRFICILSFDSRVSRMLFVDMRKNKDTIHVIMETLGSEEKRKFISLLEIYNAGYELNYDMVELVKDIPD
jgi:hypothetical protein